MDISTLNHNVNLMLTQCEISMNNFLYLWFRNQNKFNI